ncbi:MAG: hypothetical protein Q9182_004948 [Xanthomendoza sp. 2 TL-2023]
MRTSPETISCIIRIELYIATPRSSFATNFDGKHPFSGIVKTNALPCGPDPATGGTYPSAEYPGATTTVRRQPIFWCSHTPQRLGADLIDQSPMAGLSSDQKIQKRLVENITLLWALCENPDQPKENEIRGSYDDGRQLSLDRERQLVDSFAFISASTDNMLRVMAICIEEDPDKIGMTIRLASNTGDLSHVTQGFNSIARILELA